MAQSVKVSDCNVGDPDLIPGWRRSSGELSGYLLPFSCLENFMDTGAWWATVIGVAEWDMIK